jgi:hypothetical protein
VSDKVLFDENPLLADFGAGYFSRLSLFSERLPVHFQILSRLFEVEGFGMLQGFHKRISLSRYD